MPARRLRAGDLELNVVDEARGENAGPAVLLIHGFPDSSHLWRNQIPALVSAGFRAIAPDLRGFGESEVGPPGDPYGDVPSHSRDLHALLTEEPEADADRIRSSLSRRGGHIACARGNIQNA